MITTMEIVSKEMIKPSSPTPHHFRNHKLSFLDQLAPPIYIPLIFFYQSENKNDVNSTQISELLKQSLSNALSQYYPLAGRINGSFSVDCNDAGIEYVETRVHAQLAEVIEEPSMEDLKKYLPKEPHSKGNIMVGEVVPLAIQVNFFACGGVAIGACISHKIADGSSLATFMNAWAAICRRDYCSGQNLEKSSRSESGVSVQELGDNDHEVVRPIFDWTSHFPPKDMSSGFGAIPSIGITKQKLVSKRFVFDEKKLATLKETMASNTGAQVKDPTRVEAITAFFWRHFIKVAADNDKLSFAAVHAVNLRPRMTPPLPEHAIGNLWWHTLALSAPYDAEKDYHNLVPKLRDAIRNVNSNFVKKMTQGDEYLSRLKASVELFRNKDVEFCNFSSWCRFPLYEVDYGWGKPIWVCTTTFPYKNLVILMSTSCGEGIEAWVNMLEDDVPTLHSDLKLLSLDG